MSRTKDLYHDDLVKNARRPPRAQDFTGAAEDEYYAEQKRKEADKARMKDIPVAPAANPRFEGRRNYPADPATDAKRFELVCREADKEALRSGMAIVVFKNREGQYLTWEEKYISSANPIEALYTAPAPVRR